MHRSFMAGTDGKRPGLATAARRAAGRAQFAKPEDAITLPPGRHDADGHALRPRLPRWPTDALRSTPRPPPRTRSWRRCCRSCPSAAFVEGSDKGGDTKAEPKIWSERTSSAPRRRKLQEEMAKLNVLAKGGNVDTHQGGVQCDRQGVQGLSTTPTARSEPVRPQCSRVASGGDELDAYRAA
jgi:hypothetical protein